MAEKKSFVLYKNLLFEIEKLSDELAGNLFISILEYVNKQTPNVKAEIQELYFKIINDIEYEWSKHNPKTDKYHWNYKGGISPENLVIRNSLQMKLWRQDVFARDKYTCRECGLCGGSLQAHHIKEFAKYPELRFNIDNGITLCKNCHNKIHYGK